VNKTRGGRAHTRAGERTTRHARRAPERPKPNQAKRRTPPQGATEPAEKQRQRKKKAAAEARENGNQNTGESRQGQNATKAEQTKAPNPAEKRQQGRTSGEGEAEKRHTGHPRTKRGGEGGSPQPSNQPREQRSSHLGQEPSHSHLVPNGAEEDLSIPQLQGSAELLPQASSGRGGGGAILRPVGLSVG